LINYKYQIKSRNYDININKKDTELKRLNKIDMKKNRKINFALSQITFYLIILTISHIMSKFLRYR